MAPRRLPPADQLSRNVDLSVSAAWVPVPKSGLSVKTSTPALPPTQPPTEVQKSPARHHVMRTPRFSIYALPDEEIPDTLTAYEPSYRRTSIEGRPLKRTLSMDLSQQNSEMTQRGSISDKLDGSGSETKSKPELKNVHWADQSDESGSEPRSKKQVSALTKKRKASFMLEPSEFAIPPSGSASEVQTASDVNTPPGLLNATAPPNLVRSRCPGSALHTSEQSISAPLTDEAMHNQNYSAEIQWRCGGFVEDGTFEKSSLPSHMTTSISATVPGQSTSTHCMVTRSDAGGNSRPHRSGLTSGEFEAFNESLRPTSGGGEPWPTKPGLLYPVVPTCAGYGADLLFESPPSSSFGTSPPALRDPEGLDSQNIDGAAEDAELNFLRSSLFNPQDLRPISDLSQIFGTLTKVFGEPGTGILSTQFVAPLQEEPMSQTAQIRSGYKIQASGFLSEGSSERSPAKRNKIPPGRYGETIYGVNTALKSRHLDIELMRIKIPHRMLLSLNLNLDARKDAISIANRSNTAGAIDTIPIGRSLPRSDRRSKKREHVGSGMFNSRSGNRRRNSDPKAWIVGPDGQRKRRRESDYYQEVQKRENEIRQRRKMKRAVEEGDLASLQEIMSKSSSESDKSKYEPATWSDLVTWRFIKLSAVVEVDGEKVPGSLQREKKEETHVSWWAVPEKAIIGMF